MYVSDHTRAIVNSIAERVRFVTNEAISFRSNHDYNSTTAHNVMAAAVYQQRQQMLNHISRSANAAGGVSPAPTDLGLGHHGGGDTHQLSPAQYLAAANNNNNNNATPSLTVANFIASPDKMTTAHAKSTLARRDIVDYAMRRVASVPPVTRVQPTNRRSAAVEAFRESAFRSELARHLPPVHQLRHGPFLQNGGGSSKQHSSVVQEVLRNNTSTIRGGQFYASSSASQSLFGGGRAAAAAAASASWRPASAAASARTMNNSSSPADMRRENTTSATTTATAAATSVGTPPMPSSLRIEPGFPHTFDEHELRGRVGVGTERFFVETLGEDPAAVRRAIEYTAQTTTSSISKMKQQKTTRGETTSIVDMMINKQQGRLRRGLTRPLEEEPEIDEVPYDALCDTVAPRSAGHGDDNDDADDDDGELQEAWYVEKKQQPPPQQSSNIMSRAGEDHKRMLLAASAAIAPMSHAEILAEVKRLGLGAVPGQKKMGQPRNSEFVTSAAADNMIMVGDRTAFMNLSPNGRSNATHNSNNHVAKSAAREPATAGAPSFSPSVSQSRSTTSISMENAALAQAALLNQRIQKRADRILGMSNNNNNNNNSGNNSVSAVRSSSLGGVGVEMPTRSSSWVANSKTSLRSAAAVGGHYV